MLKWHRKSKKPSAQRPTAKRRPQIEALEQRLVLSAAPVVNLFAIFQDQVVAGGDVRSIGFTVDHNVFGGGSAFVRIDVAPQAAATSHLAGDYDGNTVVDSADFLVWKRQFGTQGISAADGNRDGSVDAADYVVWRDNFGRVGPAGASFTPMAVQLRDGGGAVLPAVQAGMATQAEVGSFAVFEVSAGEYSADVAGIGTGAFELRMTLIGDLDGDRDVDAADLEAIRNLSRTGGYDASADVNLDGAITSFDYSYARRNNERTLALTPMPQVSLQESNSFASRYSEFIDLSPVDGSRTLTIDVDAAFDLSAVSAQGDLFQVYLLDASTGEPLLAGVGEGSGLFSLSESGQELLLGRVTYSGGRITVDLSGITGADNVGELVLQLLSGDADEGSLVKILDIQNETSEESASLQLLSATPPTEAAGPSLDLGSLTQSNDVEALISSVRFDPAEGVYRAHLRVKNHGASTGRSVAVVFPDLPNSVSGVNASGVTASGSPYWNLRNAISSGGLQAGAISEAIDIAFSDPAVLRLILSPQVLVGGPNRAPDFGPLTEITLHPGAVIETTFSASDLDGDDVRFSIRSATSLPSNEFSPTGRLTFRPGLNDLGTYLIDVTATDGVASTTQTLALTIAPDLVTTTRISGVVLDTNGLPLENVPVEIAGYSALTAADGSFTIALPTMKTPTEAFNVSVPAGDVFLDPFNTGTQEIPLRRARFDVTTGDSLLNPRQNPNLVSSFIDASVVYGSDATRASALRTFTDGKLKTSPGNLLPINNAATFPDGLLENDNEGRANPTTLFSAGDIRTNENVALIAIHTVLMREHNRLADQIKAADPNLSDEAIYQLARRMVGAIIQNITYNEYLPLLLGTGVLAPYTGYNPTVDPSESALFAAAAFRLGHTQLSPEIERLDASGQSLSGGPIALSNAFFSVDPIKTDGIEPFLRGLAVTPMQEMDTKIIDAVRNFLFGPPGSGGMDLASLNIQRGRDVGLPSYTQARLDFGLSPITSFAQITSNPELQSALASVYGAVDKIDVWVGGLAENRAADALVGPLFQAILKDQFQRSRDGDRFWFENGQFTPAELTTIRGTTLEQLIERNAPGVELPAHPFTTGVSPIGPAPAGSAAAATATEFRTYDGSNNNLANPTLGATGSNVLRNFTNGYGDGISTPGGADRPGAREISNAINSQSGSIPNSSGITSLLTFWGQLLDHDLGLTPGGVSDTLKIQGNLRPVGDDGAAYPFVAEKMGLMLDHPVYPGVNNVIARPIYLPAIDVANAVTINPAQDTLVTTGAIEGASVLVKAGTLQDRQGHLFTGQLSITEVPRDFTPAALPSNLLPDLVVTIQPADMVFTTPAPLSLPNRAGWAPGTMMDLWSINPITGFFDKVGVGKVSADGSVVETISGGIRNSSWHLFSPTLNDDLMDETPDQNCNGEDSISFNSSVGLLTGSLIESHNLTSYDSLGASRGLTLVYDSKRAQPRADLRFSLGIGNQINAANQGNTQSLSVLGSASIFAGGTEIKSVSTSGNGNEQLWSIDALDVNDVGSRVHAGLSISLDNVPTGFYSYTIKAGGVLGSNSSMAGTRSSVSGKVATVNSAGSAFGAGWGLAGLTEVHEADDGSVLLVDGDGSESIFGAPTSVGGAYKNPMGHFGSLVKQTDGTFVHTTTDKSVYQYNAGNKLSSITDRNGNVTRFEYAGAKLVRIVDPANLATTFQYVGEMVSSIMDPAGRVTTLGHDGAGNLTSITDPDTAVRTWKYNAGHLMSGETTQRNFQETTLYNSAGMVSGAIRADGTVLTFTPALAAGLATGDTPFVAKLARTAPPRVASLIDGNGSTTRYEVDKAGQYISSNDGAGGLGTISRNDQNLITSWRDGRGNTNRMAYDALGNLTILGESLATSPSAASNNSSQQFSGQRFSVGDDPRSFAIGDVNDDGRLDVVTANYSSGNVSVLLGDGFGGFLSAVNYVAGSQPQGIALGDVDGNGSIDIVVANYGTDHITILSGDNLGTFTLLRSVVVGSIPFAMESLAIGDLNGDPFADIAVPLSSGVSVLLGDGSGGLVTASYPAATGNGSAARIVDFNGDGNLDVVTTNASSVNVLLGNGGGGLAPARNYSEQGTKAIADVNDDGRLDVISAISGGVRVRLADAMGNLLPPQSYLVGFSPSQLVVGDINGDGNLDIVVASGTDFIGNRVSSVAILMGDGAGGFALGQSVTGGTSLGTLMLADLNIDGHLDLTTAFADSILGGGSVKVFLGHGGEFAFARSYGVGNRPNAVALGDVNGDGKLDAAVANVDSRNVSILTGTGDGGFDLAKNFNIGYAPTSIALGDVNGDDRLDIVTAGSNANSLSIFLGDGDGSFALFESYLVGSQPVSVTLADLDANETLDIVTAIYGSNVVTILMGDGTGHFVPVPNYIVDRAPQDVAIGDINGDGRFDIVTANHYQTVFGGNTSSISVLLADDAGGFAPAQDHDIGSEPESIVIGDFNGDAQLDIVTANFPSKTIRILLGNGLGGFAPAQSYAAELAPTQLSVGDPNGDGFLDVVSVASFSDSVSILLGDGHGGFFAAQHFAVGGRPNDAALADINGDNRLDVVTANSQSHYTSSDDISVLLNTGLLLITATTTTTYDPTFSRPISRTDERGIVTSFTIDPANGNTTEVSGPEGQRMGYTYTAAGLIDTMTDSLGRVTDYDYNALGRLTTVTYAKGTVDQGIVRYEYDLAGNMTAMIDELTHRTEYEYDRRNRLTLVRDSLNNETKYEYDKAGNVTRITDALNQVTTNEYDARDRLIRTTDFQNNVTQFAYDSEGNLVKVIDPLGNVTKHRYDARDRRSETIDPDGGKTLFRYDADDNLIALTDPEGNRTLFFYDARNRLTKETDPLGKSITYKYDAANNLVEKKDRDGRVTRYAYDGLNRLKTETWVGDDNVFTYSYDTESNLLDVADDFSRLSYTYDARYRVTSVDNHGSQAGGTPQAPRVVVNYAYDAANNVLSVIDTINGAAGATTSYLYDALIRLTKLTQTGAGLSDKRVDFGYNDLSQTTSIDRYRDLAGTQTVADTTFAFDTLNRIESITHENASGSMLAFYDYVYDDASRITRITDIDGVTNYGYDDRDQLTSANHSDPGQADESYAYDANGNRESSHLHGSGYVIGPGNRLLSDGTYNYQYDNEGNTVKRTEITTGNYREFIWDHRNRLTTVIDKLASGTATQIVEFTYDAFDRRISKSVDTTPLDAVDAAFTSFVYDREDVILDFVDGDGAGPAPMQLAERYLHGPAIDQVLAQDDGVGTTHWMLTDHLGSVRDLVTNAGTVAEHVVFDSFGNADSLMLSRYGFTGREYDAETKLSYYRSRYYEAANGRFINEDSFGLSGGVNQFVYASNSPTGRIDPPGTIAPLVIYGLGTLLFETGLILFGHDIVDTFEDLRANQSGMMRDDLKDSPFQPADWLAGGICRIGSSLGGRSARPPQSNGPSLPPYSYRGDNRPFSQIFDEGFAPWGTSDDLFSHALNPRQPNSGFVSTSDSFDVARGFGRNVYAVDPKGGINVNNELSSWSPWPGEREIAVPGRIPASQIRGVTEAGSNMSIPNPKYRP
jgi:RHS repeat-associated protein